MIIIIRESRARSHHVVGADHHSLNGCRVASGWLLLLLLISRVRHAAGTFPPPR